eukprot:1030662-Lingulodinium_polyedra.AAC.1
MRGERPPTDVVPPENRPGVRSRPPAAFRPKTPPPRGSSSVGRRPKTPEGEATLGRAPPPTRPSRPGRGRLGG